MTGIGKALKIHKVDGLTANRESISEGYCPLTDGYFAVLRKHLLKDHNARKILEFLKFDEATKDIVNAGFVHIKN